MPKYIVILVLLIVCIGCGKQSSRKESDSHSRIPHLHIFADPMQVDSIYHINRKKIPAYAVFISEEGDTLYDDSMRYIRTRGNQTFQWTDKKSFTIKLNHGTKFPGLRKNKNFILLANAFDESHVRNAIAYDMAKAIGVLAPDYIYISLYINDEYKGLYQMTNKVEVSKRMVNIANLEKENKELNQLSLDSYPLFKTSEELQRGQCKGCLLPIIPPDISGGYLLRYDWEGAYERTISGFVSDGGDAICVEEPKHCSQEEIHYIKDYYNRMEYAIQDTSSLAYKNYIDVESFAKYYLLQEILLNIDGGMGSMYMYKDKDDKIVAGPLWDMDATLDNAALDLKYTHPNMLCVQAPWHNREEKQTGGLLYQLSRRRDFREYVRHMYVCMYVDDSKAKFNMNLESDKMDSLFALIKNAVEKDFKANGNRYSKNYETAFSVPITFLEDRLQFMDWYYTTPKDSIVCLTDISEPSIPHDRRFEIFFPKGKPITLPHKTIKAIRTPTPVWYIAGTDSVLQDGMRLYRDYDIECRLIPPSSMEMNVRRIKKLLKRVKRWRI